MKRYLITMSAFVSLAMAKPVWADTSEIAVSIAPLRFIVEQVAGDFGNVSQIVPQGQSAHDMSLRPSQRRLIANADLIFMSHPQLEASLASLVEEDDKRFILLADHVANSLLPVDESRVHDHDHHDEHKHEEHEEHHDEHKHEEHDEHHDEHKHEEHEEHHDEHKHEEHDEHHDEHKHEEHDDHHDEHDEHHADVTAMDLHIWMAPLLMASVAEEITDELSDHYPEKSAVFEANNEALQRQLAMIDGDIKTLLSQLQTGPFITMHHVTAYLEDAYNLNSIGTILPHAEGQLSAGRLRELQDEAKKQGVSCLFYEPEFSRDIANQLAQDLGVEAVLLDPLGSTLAPGADVADYWQLMKTSLKDCFTS